MARIVSAMVASHAPSIGTITDWNSSPQVRALGDGFEVLRRHIHELQPDVLVLVYDDHVDNFFFNAFPTFSIGIGESYPPADEGHGPADVPHLPGAPEMSAFIARHLVEQSEFDMNVCQELAVDHGVLVPMRLVRPEFDMRVIPLVINTVQRPCPTARRCWQLGRALAAAIAAWPGDERVALLATGGLAHQLGGERFGWIAEDFDRRFLGLLTDGPREAVGELTNDEIDAAGNGTNEIRNWIAVAGAVPHAPARVVYYEPLGITGTGIVLYEV